MRRRRACGSESGKRIEDDLIDRCGRSGDVETTFPNKRPKLMTYGIAADEEHRLGLPRGGTLDLMVEFDPDLLELQSVPSPLVAMRPFSF